MRQPRCDRAIVGSGTLQAGVLHPPKRGAGRGELAARRFAHHYVPLTALKSESRGSSDSLGGVPLAWAEAVAGGPRGSRVAPASFFLRWVLILRAPPGAIAAWLGTPAGPLLTVPRAAGMRTSAPTPQMHPFSRHLDTPPPPPPTNLCRSRLILSARHWLRAAFPAAFLPGEGPSQGWAPVRPR
ncbi:hypothetical protein DV515_00008630 [Chloebia gouldiae]|uniref:Uncharacterized protein n=1 Tax=Chloebia gouldiae TaxID=44316 RepID=A0A3L8SEZ2_CHLGU|nr:hypothetical protein DV515_00008630 [Chloebia gouldiae]